MLVFGCFVGPLPDGPSEGDASWFGFLAQAEKTRLCEVDKRPPTRTLQIGCYLQGALYRSLSVTLFAIKEKCRKQSASQSARIRSIMLSG